MSDSTYVPNERRPLATRQLRISHTIAHWLAECGVSANAISLAGLGFGMLAGFCLAATGCFPEYARIGWVLGALCVQLRLAANMLDGMVAIESKQASRLGELYNEIPDRVSDSATLIGLGYAVGSVPILGFAAAGAAIFTAYVRAMGKVAGGAQEFCGPMAKPQRMFTVTVLAVFMALSPASWQPTFTDPLPIGGWPAAILWFILIGSLLTALRRLRRIAAALRASPS